MSRQPRRGKPLQADTLENEASTTEISEQSPSSFSSRTFVQEPEPLSDESARSQTITSSSGTTTRGSTHDASSETIDFGPKRTAQTVTTTTTTKVEKTGLPASQAISNQQRQQVQGSLQRKPSVHFESVPRTITSTSTSTSLESRRFSVPMRSSGAIENSLFEIQHLHRQENDHMLLILKVRLEEHQQREQVYIERFGLLETEREELVQKLNASTTEITILKIRLSFFEDNQPGPAPSYDGLDTSVTTTITTVITTITTVTTQIEQWKDAVFGNKGNLTLEKTDLDQLSLSLSNASAQLTKLQRDYGEVSKEFMSVRRRLEMTSSLCDEKDRTIKFITEEDAGKAQQIIALRRDNDSLRRDIFTLTTEIEDLRQNPAVSDQLAAVREELKKRAKVIEEKEYSISSLQDDVTRLERSEATKTREITTLRKDYETLQRDSSEEIAELRKRCATLTKERDNARNELYESKSLVDGKDRTITKLKSEVSKLEGDIDSTAQQQDAALQEKEGLQKKLAASASELSKIQEAFEVQSKEIVSLRGKLQIKETLLSEQEHVITSITTERDQARREVAAREELLASARQKAEQLQQEVTAVRKEKADLQGQFEAQLIELNSLRDELDRLKILVKGLGGGASGDHLEDIIRRALEEKEKEIDALRRKIAEATTQENELLKSRDELSAKVSALIDDLKVTTSRHEAAKGTIDSLTVQVGQLKASVTEKTEQLGKAVSRVMELDLEVETSTSQLKELQGRFDVQSQEFITVKNQLSTLASSVQEKDRVIPSLTAERDQLAYQITEIERASSVVKSRLTELQEDHKKQSDEFLSVRRELDTCKVTIEDRDRDAVTLKEKITELERTNTLNDKRIVDNRKQIADQQQELTNSRSRINVLVQDNETQSANLESLQEQLRVMNVDDKTIISSLKAQVEDWRKKHGAVGDELKTARNTIEQLRLELDSASSKYSELERTLTAKITDLQQLESSKSRDLDATRKNLTAVQKDLGKLQNDLSSATSKLTESQEKYERETKELKLKIDQLDKSSAASEKDLATARSALEELKRKLNDSTVQIANMSHDCEAHSAKLQSLQEQFLTIPEDSSAEEWEVTKTRILSEVQDYAAVIKLTAIVDKWVGKDAERAKVLALELEARNKENEELRQKLLTLRDIYIRAPRIKQIFQSDTIQIKTRYEEDLKALKVALNDSQNQLRNVQRVVATADTYADETIFAALKKLNAEVQQNTTYMAEHIAENFQPAATKLTQKESKSVFDSIGEVLANGLASMEQDDAGLYLPIAFQAFFSHYLRQAICSWTIEKGHNEFINEIYERLQKAEPQPMSGRWRALTRAYISPTWMSNSSSIAQQILSELSYIVVAARCATSSTAANSKLSSYKDKVLSIIMIAGQFSEMIGKTVSADFAVVAPSPRQPFEDATMEQEDDMDDESPGKGSGTAARTVLCSTQLGMTKHTSGGEKLTVTKAKVVFESFLQG